MDEVFCIANTSIYKQLIHHTIGNFNIYPDKNALGRINDSLSTLQQARDLRLREAESKLKSRSPRRPYCSIHQADGH